MEELNKLNESNNIFLEISENLLNVYKEKIEERQNEKSFYQYYKELSLAC